MKLQWLKICSSVLLIGTLLFAQVALNFFHKNHDIHQLKTSAAPLKEGAAGVQTHDGEHCRVCAVDGFHHAFVGVEETCFVPALYSVPSIYFICSYSFSGISFSQGRAPPAIC